jgi:hypothetical protein
MTATNDAIVRASSRPFLARTPLALAKLPKLERIDLAHGHAGREQGPHDTTLVAAARLETDRREREAAQPLDEFGPTGRVMTHPPPLLLGRARRIDASAPPDAGGAAL